MDEALKDLWQSIVPDVGGWGAGNGGSGIYQYWRQHRQRLGSPVGPERVGANGRPFQAFASGIVVRWDANATPHEV